MPGRRRRSRRREVSPPDVQAIRARLSEFYETEVDGRKPCNAKFGVYAFFDFDGEPIYVGQTREKLRGRIGRHLTNQRTDAVAMFVLDPFEVESVAVWPFWDLQGRSAKDPEAKRMLDAAEHTVYVLAVEESKFRAVLNEKRPPIMDPIVLPPVMKGSIIPDELKESRSHPDIRIARRSNTIASLARVISERGEVNPGLRHTLVVQARRLEWLAKNRVDELGAPLPEKKAGEETGDSSLE